MELDLQRYPILLLHGPSQCGKTLFVHWFIPGILEINCSGGVKVPDVRAYDRDEVPGIFFDEAKLDMIIAQKKLFQSTNRHVKLGQTTSGQYSYDVYAHKCMMVVANNTYLTDYKSLSEEDAAWLDDNCVVVFVQKGIFFDA